MVDPKNVTRAALQNAASIVSWLRTTEYQMNPVGLARGMAPNTTLGAKAPL